MTRTCCYNFQYVVDIFRNEFQYQLIIYRKHKLHVSNLRTKQTHFAISFCFVVILYGASEPRLRGAIANLDDMTMTMMMMMMMMMMTMTMTTVSEKKCNLTSLPVDVDSLGRSVVVDVIRVSVDQRYSGFQRYTHVDEIGTASSW